MHGTMHLARELMLKATVKAPLAVVRSTLIYGEGDPADVTAAPRAVCRNTRGRYGGFRKKLAAALSQCWELGCNISLVT
jgi:hypothetical protein